MAHLVYCQDWEEAERGWGTRPDGVTLHFDRGDVSRYIKAYWAKMPDETPNEYSRPCGQPYGVFVDDALFALLSKSNRDKTFGLYFNQTSIPPMELLNKKF